MFQITVQALDGDIERGPTLRPGNIIITHQFVLCRELIRHSVIKAINIRLHKYSIARPYPNSAALSVTLSALTIQFKRGGVVSAW